MDRKQMPNILLILTDDQRYNTIHALGNKQIHTPTLDFLVQNGTSFVNAHIPGGTSGAVCMPSRAMLHSGRSLFHLDDMGQDIPEQHTTLGEALQAVGYDCFGTGKWHNGPPAFTRSFAGGENIFFGGMWDHWNVPTNRYDPTGKYDNVINFVADFFHSNETIQIHCDQFNPGKHSSELLTDTAIDFIENRKKGSPFFLYTAYLAPHDPRTMPKEYMEMYDPKEISLPENFMSEHPFDFGVSDIRDEVLAATPRNEAEIRRHIAEYYGMISHLDHEIGRIIDALKDQNELENTLIILAGDNGLALGCHGLMGKQSLYDHSIRVPLIFCGPNIPQNQIREQYVYLFDIFPTICDLLNISTPESVEGISFAQTFQNSNYKTRNQLYLAYCDLIRGLKNEQYKLVEYCGLTRKTQLFDLQNDPNELINLADSPDYTDIVNQMRQELISLSSQWENAEYSLSQNYWNEYYRSANKAQS